MQLRKITSFFFLFNYHKFKTLINYIHLYLYIFFFDFINTPFCSWLTSTPKTPLIQSQTINGMEVFFFLYPLSKKTFYFSIHQSNWKSVWRFVSLVETFRSNVPPPTFIQAFWLHTFLAHFFHELHLNSLHYNFLSNLLESFFFG